MYGSKIHSALFSELRKESIHGRGRVHAHAAARDSNKDTYTQAKTCIQYTQCQMFCNLNVTESFFDIFSGSGKWNPLFDFQEL